MNIINKIACRIFLIAFFVLASACNTVPTSSSSSTAGSPAPSGSSSSSSSSSSSGTSAGSPAGSPSTSSGEGAGKQSPASQTGSNGTGEETGKAQAGAGKQGGQEEKSDDEILADALGEFSRETSKTKSEGTEQGESGQQAAGIGSVASTGKPGSGPGDKGQGAQTDEEKARQLDEQLNRKFAKFDNLMLGEREKVAKGDNEAGSGNGMSGMGNGPGDGDGGDGYAGNDALQTAMANGSSTSGSLGVKSTRQVDSISEAPADVGNGQDDDIIARQLREAAQKEQDPELRARLWDEYRKYKKGA